MIKEVFIVDAKRTPIGSFGGMLKNFSAIQLASFPVKEIIKKNNLSNNSVDEMVLGCVLQANLGQSPTKQVARLSHLPDSVICSTVNKVCASGMKAISMAAQSIMLGNINSAIVGGMESMTNVPYYSTHSRWGKKFGDTSIVDGISKDGLTDVYNNFAMGCAGDLCAQKYNISRESQDEYAISSYKKSQHATENGFFANEIVPIIEQTKKGEINIDKDEEPYNVFFDKITKLKPAFTPTGSVTAANASTINDGAAALLLCNETYLKEHNLTPIAFIKSFADAEQDPVEFTTTPSVAIPKALKQANISLNDIDYFEINEAFSVVALANIQILKLNPEIVNIWGGGVSLGHPVGTSGARIVITLVNILKQNNKKYGVAGICNGGGGASAMVIERI